MDSGFIGSVAESLIPNFSACFVQTLKSSFCNILFTLALKSFYRLDFIFLENVVVKKKFDSGSLSP